MIGKIIGAVLGYLLLRNLPGIIFGALLGHLLIDQRKQRPTIARGELERIQTIFFNTVFTMLGHVAKADGHISENEIKLTEIYMEKMGLTTEHRREAIRLFKVGTEPGFSVQEQLTAFMAVARRSPNLRQMLLVYLVNVAMADGGLGEIEAQVLRETAATLGFSKVAFEQLLQMIGAQNSFAGNHQASANDVELAYQALGVTKANSDAEIKKAYRKLMSQFHPDKLIGQGLPDDMIKAATERSQEIQAAYDVIQKSRL
ncbi:MAG: co-chaperone DjlA [Pseudomonadota bacterium]